MILHIPLIFLTILTIVLIYIACKILSTSDYRKKHFKSGTTAIVVAIILWIILPHVFQNVVFNTLFATIVILVTIITIELTQKTMKS